MVMKKVALTFRLMLVVQHLYIYILIYIITKNTNILKKKLHKENKGNLRQVHTVFSTITL